MFAVIKSGGKQYRVSSGLSLALEKIPAEPGDVVTFDEVLMLGGDEPVFGTPVIRGATVSAEVIAQERAPKIRVFKKKRRKNYRRTYGHRQHQTLVRITEISGAGVRMSETEQAHEE